MTLFLWSSVWLRALRWRYLYRRDLSPSTVSLYRAELIGYFGNNILPLRLGELLRSYFIGEEFKLSKSYVFGTIIMERLMDLTENNPDIEPEITLNLMMELSITYSEFERYNDPLNTCFANFIRTKSRLLISE